MITYKGSKVKAINYKGNDVKIVQKGTVNCWAKTVSATVNVSAMHAGIEGNLVVTSSVEPTQKVGDVLMQYTNAAQNKTISSYYRTRVELQQNYPARGENFTVPARLTGATRKFNLSEGFPKPGTCVLTYQGNKLYDSHSDGKFYAENSSSPANASIDYIKQELTVAIASSSEQVIVSLTYDRLNAELEYNSRVFIDNLNFWDDDIISGWTVKGGGTVTLNYWDDFSHLTQLCPYEGTTIWAKIVCNGKTYYVDNNASSKDIEITGLSSGVLYRCQGYANTTGAVESYFAQFSNNKVVAGLGENTTLDVVTGTKTLGTRPVELQAEDLMIGYLLPPTITKTLTTVTGVTNYYIKITNPNPVDVHCTFSWAKKNNNFMQSSTFVLGANATSNYYGNPCYDLLDGNTGSNTVTVYLKKTDGDWANAQINQSQSISEPVPTAMEETTTAQ